MPNIQINITTKKSSPTYPSGVVTLLRWGQGNLTKLTGWTTVLEGGNFQHIDLVTLYPDGYTKFGAIDQFQRLPPEALAYWQSIQPLDGWTVKQKQGWYMNETHSPPERPAWTMPNGEIRFGLCAFGGQKLLVETDNGIKRKYYFKISFPAETGSRIATFYKVIPLPKSMWGKVSHESHPYWIQKCTEAFRTPVPDTYGESPKGTIYHPVWDYTPNKGQGLYIAEEFCA